MITFLVPYPTDRRRGRTTVGPTECAKVNQGDLMNAPDSPAPEPPSLSEPRLTRLREVIKLRLHDPSLPDEELRVVLREVATEARSRSLRPESLIVALKSVMAEIGTARPIRNVDEQRRLQEWLVTTCIEAYFERKEKPPDDPA